jgi:hypothetical protein
MRINYRLLIISPLLILMSCKYFPFQVDESNSPSKVTDAPVFTETPYSGMNIPDVTPTISPLSKIVDEQNTTSNNFGEEIYSFNIQPGTPTKIASWLYGCEWLGVAGQVFDMDGHPMEFLIVEAGGMLAGQPVLGLSLAGTIFEYGPGGYEITLSDHPIESNETIWIQLKDLDGFSLSPKIYLNSTSDCSQNLIIINFLHSEFPEPVIYYYPLIFR